MYGKSGICLSLLSWNQLTHVQKWWENWTHMKKIPWNYFTVWFLGKKLISRNFCWNVGHKKRPEFSLIIIVHKNYVYFTHLVITYLHEIFLNDSIFLVFHTSYREFCWFGTWKKFNFYYFYACDTNMPPWIWTIWPYLDLSDFRNLSLEYHFQIAVRILHEFS